MRPVSTGASVSVVGVSVGSGASVVGSPSSPSSDEHDANTTPTAINTHNERRTWREITNPPWVSFDCSPDSGALHLLRV